MGKKTTKNSKLLLLLLLVSLISGLLLLLLLRLTRFYSCRVDFGIGLRWWNVRVLVQWRFKRQEFQKKNRKIIFPGRNCHRKKNPKIFSKFSNFCRFFGIFCKFLGAKKKTVEKIWIFFCCWKNCWFFFGCWTMCSLPQPRKKPWNTVLFSVVVLRR